LAQITCQSVSIPATGTLKCRLTRSILATTVRAGSLDAEMAAEFCISAFDANPGVICILNPA
jgi:hypothetical protein